MNQICGDTVLVDVGGAVSIAPKLALTAAHVVDGQDPSQLRFRAPEQESEITQVRVDRQLDAAVLDLETEVPAASAIAVATARERWASPAPPSPHDPHLGGIVDVPRREFINENGLPTTVQQLLVDQDVKHFAGYSGAAVTIPGRDRAVVGILIEQQLERFEDPDGFSRPATNVLYAAPVVDIIDRFGLDLPVGPARPEPPYLATVRAFRRRTSHLQGRERDLARITAFATGKGETDGLNSAQGYAWLTAEPWAGKTALLAELIHRLPSTVEGVAFFVSRRGSTADCSSFLTHVVPQLAWILDVDPPPPDEHEFRRLWELAVDRAIAHDRQLLLVVDGLDEDTGESHGRAGTRSIAGVLPTLVGSHARVLVASRPLAKLPPDVDPGDPIAVIVPTPLESSPEARLQEDLARAEIDSLLSYPGSDLAYDILGMMSAATGPLTVTELAELTQTKTRIVRGFIEHDAVRTVQPVGAGPDPPFVFAHDTLLDTCRAHPDLKVGGHLDRLLEWSHDWATRPASRNDMPQFVLRNYIQQLAATAQWTDLWLDILRPEWGELRESRTEDFEPYEHDLRRLITAAGHVNAAAVRDGTVAPAIAAAVGATAILAHVEDRTRATAPELIRRLVADGRWSSERALRQLARISGASGRAVAIGVVAPALTPRLIGELSDMYRHLDGSWDDERGQAAFGLSQLMVLSGQVAEAVAFARAEFAGGRPCEAVNAAIPTLEHVSVSEAGAMLVGLADWSADVSGFALWRAAERLTAQFSRGRAGDALRAAGTSMTPADYLDKLCRLSELDPLNLSHALNHAAAWMTADEVLDRCWHILATAESYMSTVCLANIARVCPLSLREDVLRRTSALPPEGRAQVLAALLCSANGTSESEIVTRLEDALRTAGRLVSTDRMQFLADLARSGHADIAIAYIRTSSPEWDDIPAIAELVDDENVPEVVRLVGRMEPGTRMRARSAVVARLARTTGLGSLWSTLAQTGSWDAADTLGRVALSLELPGGPPDLPLDPSLRLAAAMACALADRLPFSDAARIASISPAPWGRVVLTSAIPMMRSRLDADAVTAFFDACRTFGTSTLPIHESRLVDAFTRKLASDVGGLPALDMLISQCGARYRPRVIAALVDVITHRGGYEPSQLIDLAGDEKGGIVVEAALIAGAPDSEEAYSRICERLSPFAVRAGYAHELEILYSMPMRFRERAVDRFLGIDFLTGQDPQFALVDTWAGCLSHLSNLMNARQVTTVAETIADMSDLGGGPRSELRAALAMQAVRLDEFALFRDMLPGLDGADYAQALSVAAPLIRAEALPAWFTLTERLSPRFNAGPRAMLWGLVRSRWGDLAVPDVWRIVDRWLAETQFGQPWQIMIDMLAFAPPIELLGGPGTLETLDRLLTVAQVLRAKNQCT